MANRILIGGIGNVFLGDDAFGVELVKELAKQPQPPGVTVVEFGIRTYDLACALSDGYDAIVLVDAVRRGQPPGTVYLIEPDLQALEWGDSLRLDGHRLDIGSALVLAERLGGRRARLYIVGCEPRTLKAEDVLAGLSEAVRAAVPKAIEMIDSLVKDLLSDNSRNPSELGVNPEEPELRAATQMSNVEI